MAEACLEKLNQIDDRMREDGLWLTGWRYGTGALAGPGAAPPPTGQPPASADSSTTAPASGEAGTAQPGPWGDVGWGTAPRYQMGVLYNAAAVLGQMGDQAACESVLQALTGLYEQYSAQLQEAGVDPSEVSGWRQEQIVTAKPVTELERPLRLDDIRGTDVRNNQDEYLGSISDVVVDPQDYQIRYVIVVRGGFLGIGREHTAVPWAALRVTPTFNSFVLPVDENAFEQAPTVDPDRFAASDVQNVDAYWDQALRG
jgi:hypothetical protein